MVEFVLFYEIVHVHVHVNYVKLNVSTCTCISFSYPSFILFRYDKSDLQFLLQKEVSGRSSKVH